MAVTTTIAENKTKRAPWLMALFVGAFAVACTEFVPVGLLQQIGTELEVSTGTAGQLVTVNALALAVGAPVLVALFGRMDQRRVLQASLAVFAAGHVLAAFAPSHPILLASRLLSGATMGLYLATAVAVAARLAGAAKQARAIATIVAGVSTATALGVPVSTLLGQGTSWRIAIGGLAVLALGALLLNSAYLPELKAADGPLLGERLAALRNRQVIAALAAIVVFWGASFTVFTYLAPLLESRAGLSGAATTGVLFLAGLGAVAGNVVGGRLADTTTRLALAGTAAVTAAALLALIVASSPLAVVAVVAIWQLAAWSFVPAIQATLYRAAGTGGDLALSFAVSGFNVGIVLGAGLGGAVVDSAGLTAVTVLGASLAMFALVLVRSLVTSSRTVVADGRVTGVGEVALQRPDRARLAPCDTD